MRFDRRKWSALPLADVMVAAQLLPGIVSLHGVVFDPIEIQSKRSKSRDHCFSRTGHRMNTHSIEIRRLLPADAELYREIRLEALRLSPEAFGSAYETESVHPVGWFAERLERGAAIFGAFQAGKLAGIVGFVRADGPKRQHKGALVGMYVRQAARGAGVGRLLVDAVLDFAAQSVELVQLIVVKGNEPARRLYEAAGFVAYGLELHALKIDGRYYDDILMAKDLVRRG